MLAAGGVGTRATSETAAALLGSWTVSVAPASLTYDQVPESGRTPSWLGNRRIYKTWRLTESRSMIGLL